jgi:hypothetical protein
MYIPKPFGPKFTWRSDNLIAITEGECKDKEFYIKNREINANQ